MKNMLSIVLGSMLILSCNHPEAPVHKQKDAKLTVKSIPKLPSKKVDSKKVEKIKNETRFYTNLSSQFNFRLTVFNNDSNCEPSVSVLKIYTKNGVFIQKMEVFNSLMFPISFDEVSSFETNIHYKSFGDDNMFGTLIIEDFNFDGLYDVALMEGCAANGNARYYYFSQLEDSVFEKDNFLTRKVSTYPAIRNFEKRQLTSFGISCNSCRKTTFRYNESLNSWKKTREVEIE